MHKLSEENVKSLVSKLILPPTWTRILVNYDMNLVSKLNQQVTKIGGACGNKNLGFQRDLSPKILLKYSNYQPETTNYQPEVPPTSWCLTFLQPWATQAGLSNKIPAEPRRFGAGMFGWLKPRREGDDVFFIGMNPPRENYGKLVRYCMIITII